jgi:hypothetical protein
MLQQQQVIGPALFDRVADGVLQLDRLTVGDAAEEGAMEGTAGAQSGKISATGRAKPGSSS